MNRRSFFTTIFGGLVGITALKKLRCDPPKEKPEWIEVEYYKGRWYMTNRQAKKISERVQADLVKNLSDFGLIS